MKTVGLLVILIVFLSTLHSAFGIWCFNCSSYDDPQCATLMSNDTASPYYINCSGPDETFCRKTVITIIDSDKYVRVTRSCGSVTHREAKDNCYESDDAFKFERSCQCFQDGCNSSATLRFSALAFFAAVVAAFWF